MTEPDELILAVARALVASGITPERIADGLASKTPGATFPGGAGPAPSVSGYLPSVLLAVRRESTRNTFARHLRALEAALGDRPVVDVSVDDLRPLQIAAREEARRRRPRSRHDGYGAEESFVHAARFFFNRVVEAGFRPDNPAARLRTPRRRRNARRHLEADELSEIWRVCLSGGDDPLLDSLLMRTALETGARLQGLVNLRVRDVDDTALRMLLREKFDKQRWVPLTRELALALLAFAAHRGSTAADHPVFRYRPRGGSSVGAPLTRRRFNTLFERIQRELPWAALEGVSLHWLRHTAGAAMERVGGVAVAAEFLGHEHPSTVTLHYAKAVAREVATAFSVLTGEQHPLAYPDAIARGTLKPQLPTLDLPG